MNLVRTLFFLFFIHLSSALIYSSEQSNNNAIAQALNNVAQAIRQSQPPKVCENLHLSNSSNQTQQSEHSLRNDLIQTQNTFNFEKYQEHANNIINNIGQYIAEHSIQVSTAILSLGYGYIYYLLRPAHVLVPDNTSWCNWKQSITLTHLTATPYHDIIKELMLDIQKKYLLIQTKASQNVMDEFLQNVRTELHALESYKTICLYAQQFYCARLFPYTYDLDIIEEKIARLYWLLDLFALWQTKELLPEGI